MEIKQNVAPTAPAPAASAPASVIAKTVETKPETKPVVETKPESFVPDLESIISSSKSRLTGQDKIRPNIAYTLDGAKCKTLIGTAIPQQEAVILRILNKALSAKLAADTNVPKARPFIDEVEIEKLVLAAKSSGALKTKQPAFRIFQYYRSHLMKNSALVMKDLLTGVETTGPKTPEAQVAA